MYFTSNQIKSNQINTYFSITEHDFLLKSIEFCVGVTSYAI